MNLKFTALLLSGLVFLSSVLAQENTDKADIRGLITKVNSPAKGGKEILATLLVEGKKEKTTQYDKAYVKITAKTTVEKRVGMKKESAKVEDLKVGTKVQADFTGPVAESYPVQATALKILILEEKK
jgi:hypothetical protein